MLEGSTNFGGLGVRVSGKTLRDFASENTFHPLGMIHTQYRNDHTALIPHRALAYSPGENGRYRLNVSYAEETGDGMVQTTIEDFLKWDENKRNNNGSSSWKRRSRPRTSCWLN